MLRLVIVSYVFWTEFVVLGQEVDAIHQPYRTTIQSGPNTAPLQCFVGTQNYEARPFVDNVTLQTCRPGDGCCYMMSSFGSTQYGCHNDCPERLRTFLCGPDPDSNLQDIYYCYCKDQNDPNCQPTDTKEKRRRRSLLLRLY
ncbi:hypothetical protein M3Y98_00443300 [Aphelenchoides besseyi]|nr:hypothetical protein M3Y98_00443300 [Aphelenchoides besseyi]KAI6202566.1 hypothetical protein M3Y96_00962400 [Aphelenchoides besseyi]